MMNIQSDAVVYSDKGNLVLVVEIKHKYETNRDWASKMRRNMLVHGLLPDAPFFLLALPDHFYLWKDAPSTELTKYPDYEADPTPFLQQYFESAGVDLSRLNGPGFELLLVSWLKELVLGTDLVDSFLEDEANDWLLASGLSEAIKLGNVVLPEAVP